MTEKRKLTKLQKLKNLYEDLQWAVFSFFVRILERLFAMVHGTPSKRFRAALAAGRSHPSPMLQCKRRAKPGPLTI